MIGKFNEIELRIIYIDKLGLFVRNIKRLVGRLGIQLAFMLYGLLNVSCLEIELLILSKKYVFVKPKGRQRDIKPRIIT